MKKRYLALLVALVLLIPVGVPETHAADEYLWSSWYTKSTPHYSLNSGRMAEGYCWSFVDYGYLSYRFDSERGILYPEGESTSSSNGTVYRPAIPYADGYREMRSGNCDYISVNTYYTYEPDYTQPAGVTIGTPWLYTPGLTSDNTIYRERVPYETPTVTFSTGSINALTTEPVVIKGTLHTLTRYGSVSMSIGGKTKTANLNRDAVGSVDLPFTLTWNAGEIPVGNYSNISVTLFDNLRGSTATYTGPIKVYTNTPPVLTVNQSNIRVGPNDTIILSGTIRDVDNDPITISASVAGQIKSVVITNTSSSKPWSLSWPSSSIPQGTYSNIQVTATDGK